MANILTVDDSASQRRLLAFTLRGAGHAVVERQDGQEALEVAATQPFALVISDVNMPVMDGLTLAKRLRALPSHKFTPILILTTEVDPALKAQAKQAGVTGWLVKPFDPDQLVATIRRLIG